MLCTDLTLEDWTNCYKQASKHSLVACLFPVVQKYMKDDQGNRIEPLFRLWLADTVQISERNKLLNDRTALLTHIFEEHNYKTCVLKGRGVAQLYPSPELRQSGDIDIWGEGEQDGIIRHLKNSCIRINNIDYVHSSVAILDDAEVEVHFRPSWMYNPIKNKKLQKFFNENAKEQFKNEDVKMGFSYPTIYFNLVYSLILINRHFFKKV